MKFIRIRLSVKFAALVITTVLLFGTINLLLIYRGISTALTNELQKRIVSLGRNMVTNSITPLLYEDIMGLQTMVDNMLLLNPDIGYCFVLDRNYHVLVHSFENGFPEGLLNIHNSFSEQEYQIISIRSQNEEFQDISMPIMSGELGTVRLGVKLSPTQKQIKNIMLIFLFMVVLFLAAGIIGALIVARLITRPIYKIVEVAENLDIKKSPLKVKPTARDEIGYLTVKFNQLIHRLHGMYLQLQKSQQMLIQTEKMAALGVMASGIAHEINNPLTGLQNSIRRILNAPTNQQQIQRYKPLIKHSLEHIADVIQNLLWFAHQNEELKELVSLSECIDRALILVAYRLEKNRITVKKENVKEQSLIKGNAQHLQQVILNIIINSIDAMPDCGTLTFQCSKIENQLQLKISDTGCGISLENLEKIFDPFFTTKPVGKGTGLGLSVSYQIIQTHGGRIFCNSSLNKGTTFTILLPVQTEIFKN